MLQAKASFTEIWMQEAVDFCRDWLDHRQEFIVHTSGSTGKPQAITLNRAQMTVSAEGTIQALHLQSIHKSLVCINPAYIGGKMMLVRGLIGNWEMTLIPPQSNPLKYLLTVFGAIASIPKFDFTALVPLQLHTILTETPELLPILNQMQAIIVGGAPVNYALQQKIQAISAPVYSTYGMTETVSHIALRKLNGVEKSDIFRVLPQIQISQDARGCLQIQGEVTNNKLLITNDLVEILEENKFRWLGRADNVANSGGVKIHLEQVEQMIDKVLTDNGFEGDFFVGVLPDEKLGQKLILLIESITQTADWEKTVRTQFKKELPLYHSPSQIFYLPHFARTETGKIHRANTQALLDSGITKL